MEQVKTTHISEWKKQEVEDIKSLVRKYNVLGIVNLENLPADQFLKIKHKLRDKIFIKTSKKRLTKIAFSQLEKEKKEISKLGEMIKGSPALLFTNEDEFKLQKNLNKNKSSAFAKPGQTANKDIMISAGPTQFTPGPMIGEFGQLGIKTQVVEGKIHIKEDKLLVKEGEEINPKIAGMLAKLGIEPMEIGLNLLFTYKNGEILTKEVLNINEQEFLNSLKLAYHESVNLAVNTSYPAKGTVEILLRKAQLNAMALESKVPNLGSQESAQEKKEEQVAEVEEEPKEETKVHVAKQEEHKAKVQEHSNEITLKEKVTKDKDVKIELKKIDVNKDEMQKAADILRQLTDKKIRGEI
jgi:large subunit ribosomal protein L10